MYVPALLSIYNRLTSLVDTAPDLEPNGAKHAGDEQLEQPIGSRPEPKFKCTMAAISGRLDFCSAYFVEYDDNDTLIVDIFFDYREDEGGTHSLHTVCDKHSIAKNTEFGKLFESLKHIPSSQHVIDVEHGWACVKITHSRIQRERIYYTTNRLVYVPLTPPDIDREAHEHLNRFEESAPLNRLSDRYEVIAQGIHNGTIRMVEGRIAEGPTADEFQEENP